jgi:hypothetical protein
MKCKPVPVGVLWQTMYKFNVQSCTRFGQFLPRRYISTHPRHQAFLCSRSLWTASKPSRRLQKLSSNTESTVSSLPEPWVDRLPPGVRPYFYLTRIDKPIGTLLLFYPCGGSLAISVASSHLNYSLFSVVNYYGLICP